MGISAYDTRNFAQFNPLSIQEIWAPGQEMRQQHDALAEEYSQQEQVGGLSLLGLKEGVDDEAIATHKAFMDQTKTAADELATKGFIDGGRRKNLYSLKQKYNSEVVPLQNQLKIRQERAEELRRMQLQDPTFRATMDPNSIGLTAGLKNPDAFNYSGVSGNQMYKSVAEKASQLSKVIEQEHPELIKSKLAFNYFTAIKSGADLSDVDAAMKREFNPEDVDKMTSLMNGIVHSTFNEFGVPQKFANNPEAQDELWRSAAQGLYAALGSKQFGTMTDSWGMAMSQRAMDQQSPDELMDEERYDPEYDRDEIKKIDDLVKNATSPALSDKEISSLIIANREVGAPIQTVEQWKAANKNMNSDAQKELISIGNSLGVPKPKTSSTGSVHISEFKEYAKKVATAQKKLYQSANKMKTISNTSKDIYGGVVSNLMSRDEFKDVDGKDIDYDTKSMANITTDFNFNKGFFLKVPKEDGTVHRVKFSVEDLNMPYITDAYNIALRADNNQLSNEDLYYIKKTGSRSIHEYKNYVAKEIRKKLSMTPGVTQIKP